MRPINKLLRNPKSILRGIMRHSAQLWPDKTYLKIVYRLQMGKPLNLKTPRTFQEKIQWLKIYRRKPVFTTMVDKYEVKDYVRGLIGEKYIIPTLGVWNKFDEIDFDKLPDKFVLKTTHGGGNCGVVVCRDKGTFDIVAAKKKLEDSQTVSIYDVYKEWPYKNVPRRIIAEEFVEMPGKEDLTDFKFFCFKGVPRYIQVIQDRNTIETIDFFDTDWNHQEFFGLNPIAKPSGLDIAKPSGLAKMLAIAGILAKDTEFLRVDLYNTGDKILFGELTFYPASGFGTFTPTEWNRKLGDMIVLDE